MGDYWQSTAQLFSSLFERPKMSEKLLTKPPFRYIFDIITETTKATGYAQNLFNQEELDPNYYSQKEPKLLYLKKIIELTEIMLKREIPVKPTRIVAGHEPENTNLLLQAIYEAAVSGVDSSSYVQKIVQKYSGESQGEEKKEERPQSKQPQQQQQQKQDQPKQTNTKSKEEAEQQRQRQMEQERLKQEKLQQEKQQQEQQLKQQQMEQKKKQQMKEQQEQQQQAQQQREEQKEQMQKQMNSTQSNMNQRPTSAMKKPPKLKSNVQVEEPSKKVQGPTGLILEKNKKDQDDLDFEDNTQQSLQNQVQNIDGQNHGKFVRDALKQSEQSQQKSGVKNENDQEGGSKIRMGRVGAKKNQQSQQVEKNSVVQNLQGKDDLETLKNLVQSLCQNTNPLGKSLEFLNDDIDSMNKEQESWRKQYLTYKTKYQNEMKITEEALQPLQDKLSEIDVEISDQVAKIQNVKAQIIKNQSIIQNLLMSVVASK